MEKDKLAEILRLHQLWIDDQIEGIRADLSEADLSRANLIGADLIGADLSRANLIGADLSEANLRGADLSEANLSRANLSEANLRGADLSRANLSEANLRGADLSEANLSRANLIGADLSEADLDYSSLPLWCGSLRAYFDDKQIIQIMYHCLSAAIQSPNVSNQLKLDLLTAKNLEIANQFHHVKECSALEWKVG